MKQIIALATVLLFTGCNGFSTAKQMNKENTLPDILQVGQNILIRDTVEQTEYPTLTDEQRDGLARQLTLDVPDGIQLIGERTVEKGIALEAYKAPTGEDPNLFKVYLVTRSDKGAVIDWVDLREFHTSEHQGPMRIGGNRFYTTDATLHFDSATHFTLHRVMTLTSLYLKDHTLTEMWRVEWDNHYEINKGRFIFKGQEETYSSKHSDDPNIDEFKARDLPKQ